MKVLGKRVLIEQTMTKKKSAIVTLDANKDSEENFDIKRVVLEVGPNVPPDTINVGDIPIFGKYADPAAIKILKKDNNGMLAHLVMDYDNIVALDDDVV